MANIIEKKFKKSTINVSSYGYNYWDPERIPENKDIFWPPVSEKHYRKNPGVKLDKQEGKNYNFQKSFDVNEKRFDNNQSSISNHISK